jgi:hypothetical protein
MARYIQVIGIQHPHITHWALRPGLIDPMHDPNVSNNTISRGSYGEMHYDFERPVKTLVELAGARVAADINTIRLALNRMPRLLEVRTGNFSDEHLRGLRAPMPISQETICCVQGYCRPNVRLRYEHM